MKFTIEQREMVTVGYFDDKKVVLHKVFEDEKKAKLAILEEALYSRVINPHQYFAYRRHIINPPTKEFMREIASKKRKPKSDLMSL